MTCVMFCDLVNVHTHRDFHELRPHPRNPQPRLAILGYLRRVPIDYRQQPGIRLLHRLLCLIAPVRYQDSETAQLTFVGCTSCY